MHARLLAHQQCHFTPDSWRNHTVLGTEGRLENFGDGPGAVVKVRNTGPTGCRADGGIAYRVPDADGTHGGGDAGIIDEFCRFLREGGYRFLGEGGPPDTSPVAARMSVAARGVATRSPRPRHALPAPSPRARHALATRSLREAGVPYDAPPLDAEPAAFFARGRRPEPGGAAR